MGLRLSRCAQCNGLLAEGEHRGGECDICLKQLVLDGTMTRYCPKDEFEICTQCFKSFYFESSVAFHRHSKWKEISVRGGCDAFYCSYCQSRITEPLAAKCVQCKFLLHAQCFEMLKKANEPGERWPQDKLSDKTSEHLFFRRPIRAWDISPFKVMHVLPDETRNRFYISDYLSSRILILHSKTLQPVEQWENAAANRTRFFLSVFCMTKVADRVVLFDRWLDFPLQVFSHDGRFLFAGGEGLATHSASCSNIVSDGQLCYLYSMRSKQIEAFDAQLKIRREFIPQLLKDELHKLEKERYDSDKLPLLFIGQLNGCAHSLLGCWIEKKRLVLLFNLKSGAVITACKLQLTEGEAAVSTLFVMNGILYGVVDKSIVAMSLNAQKKLEEIGRVTLDECEDGLRVAPTRDELICFLNSSAATKRLAISFEQPLPSIALPAHLQRLCGSDAPTPSHDLGSVLLAPSSFSTLSATATITASRTDSVQPNSVASFTSTPTHSILRNVKSDVRVAEEDTKTFLLQSVDTGQKDT